MKRHEYGSTDAFLADIKWIQHNSCIFNTEASEFSQTAKKIVRKAEIQCQVSFVFYEIFGDRKLEYKNKKKIKEIENCPGCYIGPLNNPTDWFTTPCEKPHPIVWGKLSGYPIWPGKAVGFAQRGDNRSSK